MAGLPTPVPHWQRRVRRLEDQIARMSAQIRQLSQGGPPRRNNYDSTHLAKTSGPSYPSANDANVFGLIFRTVSFTRAAGKQTPTYEDHSAAIQDYGISLNGYIPEGTNVLAKRQRNGQYLIAPISQKKSFCWWSCDEDVTPATEFFDATIEEQWGYGEDHTDTAIVVYNLPTHDVGVYEWEGDTGDWGTGCYDPFSATWAILFPECP